MLAWIDGLSTPEVLLFVCVALACWLVTSGAVERRIERDQRGSWVLAAMLSLAPGRDHAALATAIDETVDEMGPLFAGPDGDLRTRALMVAVAFRESSLRVDAEGDGGRSVCAFQIYMGRKGLLTDAKACAVAGMRRLRESVRQCPAYPIAAFAAGYQGCKMQRAQRISNDRVHIARTLIRTVKEPTP